MTPKLYPNEKIKDIKGFESLYAITTQGRVWSYFSNKFLSFGVMTSGYRHLVLCKNKQYKTYSISRLVAINFLENKKMLPCVNHIDGNKINNNINNLEWCTYSENSKHAYRTGLSKYCYVEKGISKYRGINYDKKSKKWRARININKRRKFLGLFDTEQQAHLEYLRFSENV